MFILQLSYAGGIYTVSEQNNIRSLDKIISEEVMRKALILHGGNQGEYSLVVSLTKEVDVKDGVSHLAIGSLSRHYLVEFSTNKITKNFVISGLTRSQAKVLQIELPTDPEGGITFVDKDEKENVEVSENKKQSKHFVINERINREKK